MCPQTRSRSSTAGSTTSHPPASADDRPKAAGKVANGPGIKVDVADTLGTISNDRVTVTVGDPMVDAYDQPRAGSSVNAVCMQALSDAIAWGNDASIWTAAYAAPCSRVVGTAPSTPAQGDTYTVIAGKIWHRSSRRTCPAG